MSIEWLTGLYEGEGWIGIDKRRPHCWFLGISSTDKDVLDRVVLVAGGKVYGPYKIKGQPTYKDKYTWYLTKKPDAVELLRKMLPQLSKRRAERARHAIELWETHEATRPKGPGARGGPGARRKLWQQRMEITNERPCSSQRV